METSTEARRARRRWAGVTIGCVAIAAFLLSPVVGRAQVSVGSSSPSSGTLGPTPGQVTTTFDSVVGADTGGTVAGANCTPGLCSQYSLTVNLPQADALYYKTHEARLTFQCAWTGPAPADDIDCLLFSPSGGQTGPGHPDTTTAGPNFEDVVVNDPASGQWTVEVEGAETPQPTIVTGTITLDLGPIAIPTVRVPQSGDPRFENFDFTDVPSTSSYKQGRDLLQRPNAGEPSVGVDWSTGNVMYMAGNQVTRITYDTSRPPVPTPTDVTPPESQVNEDAILFTDRDTNRTWALGLLLAGSYLAFSDDDGATWTPSVAFAPPALPDHETLGSGPYHQPAPSGAGAYPHAIYYCAQTIVQDAYCARSDDGGMTFNSPATALWNGTCTAIHGHVRVGPTGIVYVPNGSCTDANGSPRSGMAVSVDNGNSYKVYMPPDSSPGTSDPSVMEGPDGVVYFGYQASDGHPMLATATHDADGTMHWRRSVDVGHVLDPGETEDGLKYGVQNTEFAEVITGDAGRAAFAFVGTGKQGGYQDKAFDGVWYLFISFTYDGGKTWHTVNATPHDPVQRGCVWNAGGSNVCRNMLDFNDIGVDKQGHVYVAYTDGCSTTADYSCDTNPAIAGYSALASGNLGCPPSATDPPFTSTSNCTFARVAAIVRQVCGRGLIAASDPGFNDSPACGVTTARVSTPGTSAGATTGSGVQGASASALPNTTSSPGWPYGVTLAGVVCLGLAAARRRRRLTR